jgi:phosphoglycerate dehydrogenase-like enzyme
MTTKVAILDDYNKLGLSIGDWQSLKDCEITVFEDHLYDTEALIERLRPFDVVCAIRERTAFPRKVFEQLPNLKLLNVTAGLHSRVFDFAAAQDHGVVCCRTDPDLPYPDGSKRPGTMMEITFGLMIACTRQLVFSDRAMRRGGWESPLCNRLADLTLGLVGLGSIGIRVAKVAKAFNMRTIAWSQNLTAERAAEHGVERVDRDVLFSTADVVSLQMRLSDRTEGMITRADFDLMKPTAYFINTSRGGLVNEPDLIETLRNRRIAGAGLDVFAVEPLPVDSPLRGLDNTVLTSHLGYSTPPQFQVYYQQMVENIAAWQAGRPIRKLKDRAPGEIRDNGFWIDEGAAIEQVR